MPRAPHLCAHLGCLERIPAGVRFCDEHRRQTAWLKTSGDERPDTGRRRHRKVRNEVLARDGYICQLRYDGCEQTASELDHVVAPAEGGETTMQNGRAACRSCHQRLSSSQGGHASAAARRGGYAVDDP